MVRLTPSIGNALRKIMKKLSPLRRQIWDY